MNRTPLAAAAVLAAGLLTACTGGETTSAARTSSLPAPTVTVTETAEPTGDVAPDACLLALDYAEDALLTSSQLIGLAGDVMTGPVPDAFSAIATMDTAALDRATEEINDATIQQEALSAELDAVPYQNAAAECRAAR